MNFYDLKANDINGKEIKMEQYKGKVVLIVNTASKCGFTPQLKELEDLYKEYKDRGVEVLGFPCNQFANQDPSSNSEISQFCLINYGVTFTMFEKIDVNGENEHPVYTFLKSQESGLFNSKIKWNFTKFLVNQDGEVVERYAPVTKPNKIRQAIECVLSR